MGRPSRRARAAGKTERAKRSPRASARHGPQREHRPLVVDVVAPARVAIAGLEDRGGDLLRRAARSLLEQRLQALAPERLAPGVGHVVDPVRGDDDHVVELQAQALLAVGHTRQHAEREALDG